MNERKLGNRAQMLFAKDIIIDEKRCVLVENGPLEILFNKDNALDIVWVRYRGANISFLSKNGLNDGARAFGGNFEGGFLYTCGMDSISSCVPDKPMHGSLHYKRCDNVYSYEKDGRIFVCGDVRETALFGKNLLMRRSYEITDSTLLINDTVINESYTPADYVLLYHVNYGYPFLDECLVMDIPSAKVEMKSENSRRHAEDMLRITPPIDGADECVYYHTLREGRIKLTNPELNISVQMSYDTRDLPITYEWKSMISGDYALGIEPATARFDDFKMQTLAPQQSRNFKIKIDFT